MTQPNDEVLREILERVKPLNPCCSSCEEDKSAGFGDDIDGCCCRHISPTEAMEKILSWHTRQCEEMFEGFEATIKELRKQHRQLTAELAKANKELERVRGKNPTIYEIKKVIRESGLNIDARQSNYKTFVEDRTPTLERMEGKEHEERKRQCEQFNLIRINRLAKSIHALINQKGEK